MLGLNVDLLTAFQLAYTFMTLLWTRVRSSVCILNCDRLTRNPGANNRDVLMRRRKETNQSLTSQSIILTNN